MCIHHRKRGGVKERNRERYEGKKKNVARWTARKFALNCVLILESQVLGTEYFEESFVSV